MGNDPDSSRLHDGGAEMKRVTKYKNFTIYVKMPEGEYYVPGRAQIYRSLASAKRAVDREIKRKPKNG